jgi:hypothetical protein
MQNGKVNFVNTLGLTRGSHLYVVLRSYPLPNQLDLPYLSQIKNNAIFNLQACTETPSRRPRRSILQRHSRSMLHGYSYWVAYPYLICIRCRYTLDTPWILFQPYPKKSDTYWLGYTYPIHLVTHLVHTSYTGPLLLRDLAATTTMIFSSKQASFSVDSSIFFFLFMFW